jgi:membrane protease YdiL (CAAX protease family)
LWLKQVFRFRVPALLYLAGAFFLPLVFGGGHFMLYALSGGRIDFSGAAPWYLYLFSLIPTALLTGGNEEPGWRGFALPGLLQFMNPVLAALVLGLVHSAWHLPLMDHYQTNFLMYVYNLVGLTFMLNWFYMKSRWSVYPVMLLHAATNVIGDFIPTPDTVLGGMGDYMLLRGTVYWAIAVSLLIITRGRLGLKSPIEESMSQHQILVSTQS